MRLGESRVRGERGCAKLAGSRGVMCGDPAWEIRRDAMLLLGWVDRLVPARDTGTLILLPVLAAVWE